MVNFPKDALNETRVFVTGATGFVGQRLMPALMKTGAQVSVLSRGRATKNAVGISHVTGDLTDAALLKTSLKGQDILINLAYDVRASGAQNLTGFDALSEAATHANIGRIVHISSITVYDGWPTHDLNETSPTDRPDGGPYRQTKIAMERRLMAGTIPAAILQPTIVYGPNSALWTDKFAEALISGGIVLPDPQGRCNGVFVDDLVQAILQACTVRDLQQERFIISGPAPFSWTELLQGYTEILGRGDIQHIPLADLQTRLGPAPQGETSDTPTIAARISALARRTLGQARFEAILKTARRRIARPGPMWPDHHLLAVLSATGTCDIAQASTRLGYAPEFDLTAGLAATRDHLRAQWPPP